MLKHMPSGSAVGHQHHQQQPHQPQHQHSHPHPQHPPPPPPQIHARTAAVAASAAAAAARAAHNRSIQPLNVSTISHHTAATSYTPNKHIPNGHGNGPLRLPPSTILNTTPLTSCSSLRNHCSNLQLNAKHRIGAREALTSLGLLCLGKKPRRTTASKDHRLTITSVCSFPAARAALADLPAENLPRRPGAAAAPARTDRVRRLRHRVRRYTCAVRAVAVVEFVLFACVRHSVPVRR